MSSFPNKIEMIALVQEQLKDCEFSIRRAVKSILVEPTQITLKSDHGSGEEFPAWIVVDFGERDVAAVYCLGGYGALGSPWGLVFKADTHIAESNTWYSTLYNLLSDYGLDTYA
jgi:hypothetical protein